MAKVGARRTTRVVAWWLSGGEEECPHCGQLYAYELEFRCPECDAPSCPHCRKMHSDERMLCPECIAGCAETEGRAHG
jgi:hypothetical protein